MYVLGLNGFGKRTHDASACIFKDGILIAFAEEERFTRKKHAYDSFPYNSIKFCLQEAKITEKEIDIVALSWDYKKLYQIANKPFYNKKEVIELLFPKKYFQEINPKIVFVNHHLSHASSAYRCSGFKDAAILVVDGQGEDVSTTLWKAKDGKISLLKKFPVKDSIGYFYEAATSFLGFKIDDAGKTMGLTSYGRSNENFRDIIKLSSDGYSFKIKQKKGDGLDKQEEIIGEWMKYFEKKIGTRNKPKTSFDFKNAGIRQDLEFNKKYKDFSASVQEIVNKLMVHLSKIALKLAESDNLCISGGVGLNCVANGKILESKICKKFFVQPICNDAGTSIGAAMQVLSDIGINPEFEMKHVYFGPEFSNDTIKKILDERKLRYNFIQNPAEVAAKLIAEGKIVGWFQGKMEGGPRALGNRSILANPTIPKMKDLVNIVKSRELWRPLCPSIIEDSKEEYLENPARSRFMILNFKVRKDKLDKISSVVHIDGTARVQTIEKEINPLYWELINKVGELSGEPVVLNTSLNGKGEPIACSPKDALNNFFSSAMDVLIIGNYIIEK